jgi:hypothetical protein
MITSTNGVHFDDQEAEKYLKGKKNDEVLHMAVRAPKLEGAALAAGLP